LQKYENPIEILDEFYYARKKIYQKRKEYLISKIRRELSILENKKKFILGIINNTF